MITKAVAVLEALARSREPQGVSQLSAQLQMPVATIHRQLQTLVNEDLARQTARGGLYELGERAFTLAYTINRRRGIQHSRAVLKELNRTTSYSTIFGKLADTSFTYIDHLPATTALSLKGSVGASGYLHATAIGKALLATLDEAEFERLLPTLELTAVTSETITDPRALKEEIARIRQQGYAVSRGENEPKVASVAVPVQVGRDEDKTLYAVCIASHISELDDLLTWVEELRLAVKRLEEVI
ncbi:IclR family transcriptional regulator [Halomonas dongshanensis]|uniref:IclR family transcriptional regulator n=1 Tax=Halomonas dongshanensis TaxID=2890835 RepID=A0ABT2EB25_9GAMM|nr:IclR family transcriptional regulator [Halomonas dongshanensis]MCS2608724.1 IclR family transcriptional regulator [Halomonas dongshanensis]